MRHPYHFSQRIAFRLLTITTLCLLVNCGVGANARAQSGRRIAKRPPASTAPIVEAEPAPTPARPKAEQPQLSLYVCMDRRDSFSNTPYYLSQTIRNVFVQRLEAASSIKVTVGAESHRADAVKRAKGQSDTYVVLLQLDSDADMRGMSTSNTDYSSLYIRYAVFAPVTGKTTLEGRVYQEQYRAGRGGIGLPSPQRTNPLYSDYLIKDAAREAADRVLEAFSYQAPRNPGRRDE